LERLGLRHYRLEHWSAALGEWPIHPYAYEEAKRVGAFRYRGQGSHYLILCLILEGGLSFRCKDGTEHRVDRGSFIAIPPSLDYDFWTTEERLYRKLVLEITGPLLPSSLDPLRLDRPFSADLAPDWPLETELRAIGELLHRGDAPSLPRLFSLQQGILTRLSLAARGEPSPESRLVARARARLENDLRGEVSALRLAEELGTSPSTLGRRFRRSLGLSISQYRIRHRLQLARRLVEGSSIPFHEIALRFGYANPFYFSNDFKKHFQVSPRACRAARQRNAGGTP